MREVADPRGRPAKQPLHRIRPGRVEQAGAVPGVDAFKREDFEAARVALSRVIELVPDKPNPYRWLGLTEARLGHCAEALRAFETFLAHVPASDPRTVEVVTLRDRCRDELRPKVGQLTVVSTPPGAEVRVHESLLGKTPLSQVTLPAGSHVLSLHKTGYADLQRAVDVADGSAVRVDVLLDKLPAPLPPRKKKRYWIIGAVLGPLAAVGLGVGLGVGLTRSEQRTLPPLMSQ